MQEKDPTTGVSIADVLEPYREASLCFVSFPSESCQILKLEPSLFAGL